MLNEHEQRRQHQRTPSQLREATIQDPPLDSDGWLRVEVDNEPGVIHSCPWPRTGTPQGDDAAVVMESDGGHIWVVEWWKQSEGADDDQLPSRWFTGAAVPGAGLGEDGDFYLQSAGGDYFEKAAGEWLFRGNLRGPAGPSGADGADGADGAPGANGLSAYEVWLAAGNVGDVNAYLAAIKGATGAKGDKGDTGAPGITQLPLPVTALPVAPADGQVCVWQPAALATARVRWVMQWLQSTGRWEKVGGNAWLAGPMGSHTLATTTQTAMSGGPSLTVPAGAGIYRVRHGGYMEVQTAHATRGQFGIAVNGGSIVAGSKAAERVSSGIWDGSHVMNEQEMTFAAGDILTLKLLNQSAQNLLYRDGWLSIEPVSVA